MKEINLDNILSESLSVSDSVKKMSADIFAILADKVKNAHRYMSKERDRIIKKGNFTYKTNGALPIPSFMVNFIIYSYENQKEYDEDINFIKDNLGCECNYEKNFILIKLAAINNVLTKDAYGSVEHELNHMLQNSFGQKKNEELYDKAVYQIRNGTPFYKQIAYALYLSFNTEISSFAVQYYAFLKNKKMPLRDVYHDFPLGDGNPYGVFLKYFNYTLEYSGLIKDDDVKSLFGISKSDLLKRLYNANKRYRSKIMKVIAKYRDELNEEYLRSCSKNVNLTKLPTIQRMTFKLDCDMKGIKKEESEFE